MRLMGVFRTEGFPFLLRRVGVTPLRGVFCFLPGGNHRGRHPSPGRPAVVETMGETHMYDNRGGPPMVLLCGRDALWTGAGHPLRKTDFIYDATGMLSREITRFYYAEGNDPVIIRKTTRDGFGVVIEESLLGEDGVMVNLAQSVSYDRNEEGKVFRIQVVFRNKKGVRTSTDVYHISYHNMFPYRRGMVRRVYTITPDNSRFNDLRFEYDVYGQLVRQYARPTPTHPERLAFGWRIMYDEHKNPMYCCQYGREPYNEEYVIDRTYNEEGLCTKAVVREISGNTTISELVHRYGYGTTDLFHDVL